MIQFRVELRRRIAEARHELARARAEQDDYLVGVRLGELEELARVAHEHDVPVPELDCEPESGR